jgi:IS5 family transposase
MYVAEQCFGLSDESIKDAVYDSQAIRAYVGIDLATNPRRMRQHF